MRPSIKRYNFVTQNTSVVNVLYNATCGVTKMSVDSFIEKKLQRSGTRNAILEYFFIENIGVITLAIGRTTSRGVLAATRSLNIAGMFEAITSADRRQSNGQG